MKATPLFLIGFFLLVPIHFNHSTPAWAFTIVEPKDSTTYRPGQSIRVTVDIGEVGGIDQVKYYWYGDQEDMLEELVEKKLALIATATSQPPYGGKLAVPRTAIGKSRLLAVAEREDRQFITENWGIFDEVMIYVEPKAKLVDIHFETDKPLRFGRAGTAVVYDQVDFLGKTVDLPVVGQFADGVVRPIRLEETGTTYQSSDESVITVDSNGLLKLIGNGQATITVTNRGKQASLDVYVEVKTESNEAPVANPGENQIVASGDRVELNGLGSYDPEGESLTYHWSQIRGSKAPLLDPFAAKASFLAPFVAEDRLFRFKLRVTDRQGADSPPSFIDVIVEP